MGQFKQQVQAEEAERIVELRRAGRTLKEIAYEVGRASSTVTLALQKHRRAERAGGQSRVLRDPDVEVGGRSLPDPPTPEEIARECAKIRKEWSPREKLKRAGIFGRLSLWRPPVVGDVRQKHIGRVLSGSNDADANGHSE